jgi:hypothetical protein
MLSSNPAAIDLILDTINVNIINNINKININWNRLSENTSIFNISQNKLAVFKPVSRINFPFNF